MLVPSPIVQPSSIVALGCAKNKDEQQVVGSGGLASTSGMEQSIGYVPTSLPMVARMDDFEKPQPQYARIEEHAFKQAKDEPVTKPQRDFDLD